MIRNLLFDWSGTVVDDLPGVISAVNGMLRAAGAAEMTREEFKGRFRLPYTEFFAEVLPGLPVERLQELYLEHFTHAHADIEILPHAREFIQFAAATGRRLVVLSSAPLPHVMAQAEALGVPFLGRVPLAMAIRIDSDTGQPAAAGDRPHGAAFLEIAERLNAWLDRTAG